MTPQEMNEFEHLRQQLAQTVSYRLRMSLSALSHVIAMYEDNAAELVEPLRHFATDGALELMRVGNHEALEQFLLLCTRRLYNHLATSVSGVAHIHGILGRMPPEVASVRAACKARVTDFEATSVYRVHRELRDYAVHTGIHATTGQISFPNLRPTSSVRVNIEDVKAATSGVRRKGRSPKAVSLLPDSIDLLATVTEFTATFRPVQESVYSALSAEFENHKADAAPIHARMTSLWTGQG